ncbi:MAG: hypothetical protein K9H16_00320 [Bacteroidales bacterium]|nr:hypothetical protein [Bacteroidales bacterium]
MQFSDFIGRYDKPGIVILLEGKRKVLPEDKSLLPALGEKLCMEMKYARFRSGNATGADELFAEGISRVDAGRMEVILPYSGHRKKNAEAYHRHSLDEINLAAEPEIAWHTSVNRKNKKLIDDFVGGISNNVTIKAAYLLRDTVKVIGTQSGIPPAGFALFYDDLLNPGSGGTGHTMMVCKNSNVPFVDQTIWRLWLK